MWRGPYPHHFHGQRNLLLNSGQGITRERNDDDQDFENRNAPRFAFARHCGVPAYGGAAVCGPRKIHQGFGRSDARRQAHSSGGAAQCG